jgi:hypothetical protein
MSAGAGAALLLLQVVHGGVLVCGTTLALLLVLRRAYVRVRVELKRAACDGCAELGAPGICSGYAQQAESIRAWRDRLEDDLNAEGAPPPILSSP